MNGFDPYQYRVKVPNRPMSMGQSAAPAAQEPLVIDSILMPVSKTLDLTLISGGTFDYFLLHQLDFSFSRFLLSVAQPVAQTQFSVQLIAVLNGAEFELSEERSFEALRQEPAVIESIGSVPEAAIYARVRTTFQTTLVYVTLELLTSRTP